MSWHFSAEDLESWRDKFWLKVRRGAPDECWPWFGAKEKNTRYGKLRKMINRRPQTARAHRVALMLAGVEVKPTDFVLHSCDNPPCCNPAHLRVGTKLDNARDREARNRYIRKRGSENHRARLNESQVTEIRRLSTAGVSQFVIAAMFGIAQTNVSSIVRRVTWRHLPEEIAS